MLTIPIELVPSSLGGSSELWLFSLEIDIVGKLPAEPVPFIEAMEGIPAEDSKI
jgi:hypothetical protein